MIVQFRWDWQTFLEQTKEDIPKLTQEDILKLKPKWITTYCGCRCIEVHSNGGMFELCLTHEEKYSAGGEVRVPQVKCDIPITYWDRLKIKMRR